MRDKPQDIQAHVAAIRVNLAALQQYEHATVASLKSSYQMAKDAADDAALLESERMTEDERCIWTSDMFDSEDEATWHSNKAMRQASSAWRQDDEVRPSAYACMHACVRPDILVFRSSVCSPKLRGPPRRRLALIGRTRL